MGISFSSINQNRFPVYLWDQVGFKRWLVAYFEKTLLTKLAETPMIWGSPKSSESYGIHGVLKQAMDPWDFRACLGSSMMSTFPLWLLVLAVEVEQWDYDLREKHREELELLMDFLNGGRKDVATEDPWLRRGGTWMGHGITQQVSNGLPYGHILNPFFFPIRSPREFMANPNLL